MALKTKAVLVMGLAILSLDSVASAFQGTATFYTVYVPSACYGYQDQGTMIAAVGNAIWNNGSACGKMCTVTCSSGTNGDVPHQPCKGRSATVKIVDRCPACEGLLAVFDLSQEAFSIIANPDAGAVNIEYDEDNNGTI